MLERRWASVAALSRSKAVADFDRNSWGGRRHRTAFWVAPLAYHVVGQVACKNQNKYRIVSIVTQNKSVGNALLRAGSRGDVISSCASSIYSLHGIIIT